MNHLPGLGIIWSLLVPLVFASQSISLSDVPVTIDEKSEMQVNVLFSCPGCGDSYIRGVFYPSGSSYFGYTKGNNGEWSNAPGSNCKTYFAILQSDLSKEGTWSGVINVKPDTEHAYYNGPGEYTFKVGRYTSACGSPSTGGWSAESIIAITGPTHTPTPIPTTVAENTPTHTPHPTNIPAPTITPTRMVSPTITGTVAVSPIPTHGENVDILGSSTGSESGEIGSPPEDSVIQSTVSGTSHRMPLVISLLCVGMGFALLSAVLAWQKTDIWKNITKPKN
jgi:hypothetical protein